MATKQAPDFVGGLAGLIQQLAQLRAAPDAQPHDEFLSNLESMLVTKVREATGQQLQSQIDVMQGAGGGAAPMPAPGGDLGGPGMGAAPEGMGMGGLGPPPNMPEGGPIGAGGPAGMPHPGMEPPPGVMGAGAPGPGRGVTPGPRMPDTDSLRRILQVG